MGEVVASNVFLLRRVAREHQRVAEGMRDMLGHMSRAQDNLRSSLGTLEAVGRRLQLVNDENRATLEFCSECRRISELDDLDEMIRERDHLLATSQRAR